MKAFTSEAISFNTTSLSLLIIALSMKSTILSISSSFKPLVVPVTWLDARCRGQDFQPKLSQGITQGPEHFFLAHRFQH